MSSRSILPEHPGIRMIEIDDIFQEDKASDDSVETPKSAHSRPRVISLANQKGGVGKTTTAINLGTALAAIGERVLIVDLDPQGNASTGLGIDRRDRATSTYDVLIGEAPLREAVVVLPTPPFWFASEITRGSVWELLGVGPDSSPGLSS